MLKLRTRFENLQFVESHSGGFEIELGTQGKVVEFGMDFQCLQLGYRHDGGKQVVGLCSDPMGW